MIARRLNVVTAILREADSRAISVFISALLLPLGTCTQPEFDGFA